MAQVFHVSFRFTDTNGRSETRTVRHRHTGEVGDDLPEVIGESIRQSYGRGTVQVNKITNDSYEWVRSEDDADSAVIESAGGNEPEDADVAARLEAAASTPVGVLDIEQRVKDLLIAGGVETVEQVEAHADLTEVKGIGKATAADILSAVEAFRSVD